MTQASVLKVTANGSNTSPVVRRAWIMKNILGKPVPPPPPDVPEPDARGATTIREVLAKHRKVEACASCHRRMDPLGFALENYDVIGGWRDHYLSHDPKFSKIIEVRLPGREIHRYRQGPHIDASDVLADGRRFDNLDDLKRLLLADPEPIVQCVAEKLLVYATGAAMDDADRAAVRALVKRQGAKKYGLRTVVHDLVESELFLKK